jgi:protein-tyrosine-phosphatase
MPVTRNRHPAQRPLRLLFVCSGNTCRSPLAEVIALRAGTEKGTQEMEVRSAGTSTTAGLDASDGALRAAKRHGLSLESHSSTPLSREAVDWADLILTMGPSHLMRVHELGGDGKSALLGAYAGGSDDATGPAVPDPYGGDDEVYEATFRTLETLVRAALERLAGEAEE